MTTKIYLEPKPGSEALKRLLNWRERYEEADRVWRDYARSIGAEQIFTFPYLAPHGFGFKRGETPEGWTKPDRKNGFSRPKRANTGARAELDALPQPPNFDNLAGALGLPSAIIGQSGFTRLGGGFWSWRLAWAGDRLFIYGGDWRVALVEWNASRDEPGKLDHGDGTIPEDFVEVSEAVVDLAIAQFKVDEEQKEGKTE